MSVSYLFRRCLLIVLALTLSAEVRAGQFCFASAGTYYEHVYCELEARGQAKNLPSFDQFKKNNEIVQALLLKAPAEKNHIELPKQKKSVKAEAAMAVAIVPVQTTVLRNKVDLQSAKKSPNGCQLNAPFIECNSLKYRLLGNKSNARLVPGVLSDTNKMALPEYQSGQSTEVYLTNAYQQYIAKMCAIGLAAVTMSYAKFAYFYQDLLVKGVSFTMRFEKMYGFLKKDKETMWIGEALPNVAKLHIEDCDALSQQYFICAQQGQNYVFELVSL